MWAILAKDVPSGNLSCFCRAGIWACSWTCGCVPRLAFGRGQRRLAEVKGLQLVVISSVCKEA